MADTIALMRKRVLDMAICGELVEQRPEEGNAENLLEQIQTEKNKNKPSHNNEAFISYIDNTPFDIPNSWKWVKIKDVIITIFGGGTPDKQNPLYWNGDIPWATVKDIANKDIYLNDTIDTITPAGFENCSGQLINIGDLIIVTRMGLGRAVISKIDTAINQDLKGVKLPECLDSMYFLYAYKNLDIVGTGTTVKGIKQTALLNAFIPLPPLAEQRRIVAKIEEIFTAIDQIGTKKEEALSIIRIMRQTALQDAIMGVLVEQDENDEPASELIKKIKNNKENLIDSGNRKKATPVEEISTENIPFEIPTNWKWTRLNELVEINLGFTYRPEYQETGKLFLSVKDLSDNGIDLENAKYISDDEFERASYGSKPRKGDLLFGRVGTLGKPRIVDFDEEFCIFVSLGFLRSYDDTNIKMEFLSYWMESKLFWQLVAKFVKGSAQQNLNTGWLKNFVVPLPPIFEQHRIVEKLDEIMAICDQMEAILDGSSEINEYLKVV